MATYRVPDVASMFHRYSSNHRENLPDIVLTDERPPRHRVYPGAHRIALPGRDFDVRMPLGEALRRRRSNRDYELRPLPLETLGRLLYLAYGIHSIVKVEGELSARRCAPSAGGLFPLELYVTLQHVKGVVDGIYHYDSRAHEIELRREGIFHAALADLTIGQEMIRSANLIIIITAIFGRTTWKYGQRGYRYVWLDAGHVGQSICLVAAGLGLGTVAIGGFFDREMDDLLALPDDEDAIYLFCVGQPPAP
jgi:SagB-type dehydrogenase family enzyme